MADWDSRWGRLLATRVVLILSSNKLPMSLSLVMLTFRRSERYVRLLLRMSSLASSVVSVMKVLLIWFVFACEGFGLSGWIWLDGIRLRLGG